MTIWKKAVSLATTATLLASLLATAVAPSAFAASGTLSCTVTGGGTSQAAAFGASAAMPGNWQPGTTFTCTNNATPAGVAAGWAAVGGQVATTPAPTATAATIVVGSAANPSSASVSFTAGDATVATITFSVLPLSVSLTPANLLWSASAAATATNAIGNGAGAGAQANATYSGSSGTPTSAGAGCAATAGTAALAAAVSTATATIARTAQGTCQAQFAYTVANTAAATVAFTSFTVSNLSSVASFWDGSVTATGGGTQYTDNATTSAGTVLFGGSISASDTRATGPGTWTATGATPASSTADAVTFTVTAPVGGTVTIQWQSPNGFYHRFDYTVGAAAPGGGSGASAVTTSGFGNVIRGGKTAAGTFTITEGAVGAFADGTVTVTPFSSAGVSGTGTTAVWFDPASVPTATVTAGLGAISASVSAGGVLTITISGTTADRFDNFTVSGLKVKGGTSAALGAVQFRYTTTGTNFGAINATASGTLTTNTGTGVQSPTYTLAAGSPDFAATNTGATPPISNATFVGGVTESVALTAGGGGTVTANFSVNHPTATTFSQTVAVSWFPTGAIVVDTTVLAAVTAPIVIPGLNTQAAGNLTVNLGDAGFVPAAATLTFAITTAGVQFSALPTATDSGDFVVGTGVLSLDRKSIVYTVTTASTTNLQVLTLSAINYDVALSATAGALVNVTLTISGGVAVSGSPAANAQIAQTIIGSGAVPTIIIGVNDQATGLLTIRESAAGTLPDNTTVATDKIYVCLTSGETFSRAPWFVRTAGDITFNVGGLAATQAKATLTSSNTCAFVRVYLASTIASTIEVRAGADAANTAPAASGPNAGATVNVGTGLTPGPTLAQVSISAATDGPGLVAQGAPVVVAMRALRGSPMVAAVSQPFVAPGGMNQAAGDVTITEGSTANFVAGETISLCLVTQALTISTDTFFANTAGVGMPVVTTNNAASGLVASIAYSSPCFVVTINNGAIGALGVITVSGLKYNVNVGTTSGPVFLRVMRTGVEPVGTDFNQVVSNARIGTMAAVAISAVTALGVVPNQGPWSTATKVAAANKFITWRFAGGSALAGKTVQIYFSTKNAAGGWGPFVKKTARVADASGNAYFRWRATGTWISVRAYYPGDNAVAASWSPARQGRWR